MNSTLQNFNWLFLVLVAASVAIGFFYLPLAWKIINFSILICVVFLLVLDAITDKKNKQVYVLEHSRLMNIINNLREGIIVYDPNFKILIFNPAAEKIFGVKAAEMVGKSFTLKIKEERSPELHRILTIMFPALAQTIIRRSEPGAYPQIADISFEEPPSDLRIVANRILDEHNNVQGFVKLVIDRTEELQFLRSGSDFIAIASHQLQTPISALNWALSNLKQEDLSLETKNIVFMMTGAVNRLLKIVTDLIDVANIEKAKVGYQFQEIDLGKLVEEALTQAKSVADQYQVRLFLEKPETGVKAIADPTKLALVIKNLLDNAIKYNIPNGNVTVKIRRPPSTPYAEVIIEDTGIGIPPDAISRVFTKFFRAENASKAVVDGTGLGLYIAKHIIRSHGGKMWVASTLNRGSTFHFTLPTNPAYVPPKEIFYEE